MSALYVLAVPATAPDSIAASVYTMSAGRLGAIVAALLGLIGVVVGGLALARPAGRFGTGNGRGGAYVALMVGLIAMVLGGLVLARSRHTG